MECEIYIIWDDELETSVFQCGNCGAVFLFSEKLSCPSCHAMIVKVVDEGEADDSFWED